MESLLHQGASHLVTTSSVIMHRIQQSLLDHGNFLEKFPPNVVYRIEVNVATHQLQLLLFLHVYMM